MVPALGVAVLLACCVTPPEVPPPAAPPPTAPDASTPMVPLFTGRRVPRSPLEVATDRLLDAIEAETGVRPAEDDEGAIVLPSKRRRRGWGPERTDLAHELLRAVETREATVRPVRRALAAFELDRMLGGRWPEVDELLVSRAVRAANDALPLPPEPADPDPDRRSLEWPITRPKVTSRFGMRHDPLERDVQFHAGIDIAAIEGQKVYAAADGLVVYAGQRGGYGLHVELKHDNGFVTRYAHLDELIVKKGQRVEKGRQIAYSGKTGRATGPHLHFELWRNGRPVDPLGELPEP